MELLVVEDEDRLASFLKQSFEAEGHVVHCCRGVEEVEAYLDARDRHPEVIILDRMLRGSDGITLIPQLRRQYSNCRILVLSAIDLPEEKARALDAGADDYLAKPFSLTELSARLRVLSRRLVPTVTSTVLHVRNITIDTLSQHVVVGGRRVDISKKEFQVLALLFQIPGRVLNKFQLLDKVWDMQFTVESNTVEATIKNLRRKLKDAGSEVEILSKRNVGYWVEA